MDQLSILILQKCPMARTILHLIICECWRSRRIPECWKRSATILIYKKGDTSDPGNFRPITLHSPGGLVQDPGISDEDQALFVLKRQQIFGQNEAERFLAQAGRCH